MNTFLLKGSAFTFPILKLIKIDWNLFKNELEKTLLMSPRFFLNAPMVLDLTEVEQAEPFDLGQLLDILRSYQLLPIAVKGQTELLRNLAREFYLGFLSSQSDAKPAVTQTGAAESASTSRTEANLEMSAAQEVPSNYRTSLVIEHPVRSGQQVYAQGCDLTILAPVSAGAEIISDGHIHVYAPLRGRVFAGFSGDTQARIFCQVLEAEFLSIAGRYLLCEHLDHARVHHSTQIYLQDDQLKIAPLFREGQ